MAATMTRPSSSSRSRRLEAAPRWATQRSPERETFGSAVAAVAERLGQPLMPWQRLVADVGGELDPDTGLPVFHEVAFFVPRQSGKTTEILAWEVQRALGWGIPQHVLYSAQTGLDARKKLIDDQVPVLERRKSKLGITRILKGMGGEAVQFRNGSRITLMASTIEAGHGKTIHLGVRDEFFADVDDRRAQAMEPAMSTVEDAQILTASTMGTDLSVPLNTLVERGRQAVLRDRRDGIAYFEWSADPDSDLEDEEEWWEFMPALGHTISIEAVRRAKELLTPGEFRRAYGNIATKSDERLIPAATWDLVCSPDASPQGTLTFAVDVNEERSAAAIVACSADKTLEVIEHRAGIGWLLDPSDEHSIPALNRKWGSPEWAYDASGPAGSLKQDLDSLHVRQHPLAGREFIEACGAFFDDVIERKLSVRRHPSLDAAVAGAARSMVGDAWKWARKTATVDLAPLIAATVGRHAAVARVDPSENIW